jgi:hypothetical protein
MSFITLGRAQNGVTIGGVDEMVMGRDVDAAEDKDPQSTDHWNGQEVLGLFPGRNVKR